MAQITASDFQQWKENSVTKAFMWAAQERIEDGMNVLSTTAGMDLIQDNYMRGFIAAYRELEQFRIDDIEGDEF
jgi:hypothetical protein